MKFQTKTSVDTSREALWTLLFDVTRIAGLIPGCSDVEERDPLKEYTALIRQKVGPFKFEMPCDIVVDEYVENERVGITASGKDKKTATGVSVKLILVLGEEDEMIIIDIDADIQISGKLATLGFPVVKKKCTDVFREFDANLHEELEQIDEAKTV